MIASAVVVGAVIAGLIIAGGSGRSSAQPVSVHVPSAAQRIDALLAGISQSRNALGSSTAPVTLQYFGDLECPTSRQFTIGALPFLIRRWVRPGRLRIEYRSLETATQEPEVFKTQQTAALAAGMQAKLWYYIELFYHEQRPEDSGYVTDGYLQSLAQQTLGLDLGLWFEDRRDPLLAGEVEADESAAAEQGFRSTPSFLIGRTHSRDRGKLLGFSPVDPSTFNIAIERLLPARSTRAQSHASIRGGGV